MTADQIAQVLAFAVDGQTADDPFAFLGARTDGATLTVTAQSESGEKLTFRATLEEVPQ